MAGLICNRPQTAQKLTRDYNLSKRLKKHPRSKGLLNQNVNSDLMTPELPMHNIIVNRNSGLSIFMGGTHTDLPKKRKKS